MASRMSEASYWGSQQLPQGSQYPSHYYSSSPATSVMNQPQQQQQQPRQAPPPLNHSSLNSGGGNSAAMEGQSGYSSAPPSSSSSVYYGNFYPPSQMNNSSNGGPAGAGSYSSVGVNGSHASQASQHSSGPSTGGFMSASHNQSPMSASHMAASPYPPVNGGHSSYHLSNNGVYLRSHPSELEGGLPHSMEGMHHQHHLSHQQQHHQHHPFNQHQQHAAYHSNSQHSGSPTLDGSEYGHGGMKPKRRQVKNACINCQKACKRCDEGRPCSRCVKYGLTDTCQDSARKERKRGIKRGPYKRRATTGSQPASAPSTSSNHFPSSSSFAAVDSLYSSASPHLRRGEEPSSASLMEGGHGMEHGMLNSPVYPSSAPGSIQRSNLPLASHEGPYGRMSNMANEQNFQAMQPPRFTSRYEYERSGTSPGLPLYNSMGRGSNNLPPPISAPASSTSFASNGGMNPYPSRGLFSPPSLLSASSANFLGTNGQNRLHSDSSLNSMATNTTQSSSLSPRTPMSMSVNGSGSMNGELGLMSGQQSLSASSSLSSPGGMNAKYGSNNNYVHHPGPTTTLNLPPTATGAFLNPPSTPSSNGFPLHIPPTVRWRGSQGSHPPSDNEAKEEQLAPIKLSASGDSDMSSGTLSGRYQLPSPRMPDMSRSMDLRPGMPKMELAQNVVA